MKYNESQQHKQMNVFWTYRKSDYNACHVGGPGLHRKKGQKNHVFTGGKIKNHFQITLFREKRALYEANTR